MVCIVVGGLFINLYLIEERIKIKHSLLTQDKMKFIKAKELKPGDVFKINPKLPKEHWADVVNHKFGHVNIYTWGRSHFTLQENDEVFFIRSTNSERKEALNV